MLISDAERTEILNHHGFDVIRFTNDEVLYEIVRVLDKIKTCIANKKIETTQNKYSSGNSVQQPRSYKNTSGLAQVPPLGGFRGAGRAKAVCAVLGITGTGGAGKSSVTDEIVRRFLQTFTEKTIAVISVDPSKKKTGGALLGDRIRMNAISHPAGIHALAGNT